MNTIPAHHQPSQAPLNTAASAGDAAIVSIARRVPTISVVGKLAASAFGRSIDTVTTVRVACAPQLRHTPSTVSRPRLSHTSSPFIARLVALR